MPTKGVCRCCGETAFLTGKLLRNKSDQALYYVMLCDRCKKFYEEEGILK